MLTGIEWLAPHLARFTYVGTFLLLFLSSFGLPIPEEVTLFAAGLLVHEGTVRLPGILAIGVLGVLAGDISVYVVGRRYGEGLLAHRVLAGWFTPSVLARLKDLERRYGSLVLVVARFIPGLRTAAMLAAGLLELPVRTFVLVDALGGLASVALGLGLGYLFADQMERVTSAVDRLHALLLVLVVLLLLALAVRVWARRRLAPPGAPAGGPGRPDGSTAPLVR